MSEKFSSGTEDSKQKSKQRNKQTNKSICRVPVCLFPNFYESKASVSNVRLTGSLHQTQPSLIKQSPQRDPEQTRASVLRVIKPLK